MIKEWYIGRYGTAEVVEEVPSNYKHLGTDEETRHHIYFEPYKGLSLAVRA